MTALGKIEIEVIVDPETGQETITIRRPYD